jgi:beta-lactamase class A
MSRARRHEIARAVAWVSKTKMCSGMRGIRSTLLCGFLAVAASGVAPVSTGADDARVGIAAQPQRLILLPPAPIAAAPLWSYGDRMLQRRLERTVAALGLGPAARERRLGIALVDITRLDDPRVAAINGDEMMYAASLPKIGIMLAVFERIAEGTVAFDQETQRQLTAMVRESSNSAASDLMDRVGVSYIADVLRSPRYQLYDERRNGGLWIGKHYAQAGLWQRDPLHDLSHGATPMQAARFYYLLETGQLVSPAHSRMMKAILAGTTLDHKFARGLRSRYPHAALYRKSGTWRRWHADSAIIEHDGCRYIAVGLCQSERGGEWLRELIIELDRLVLDGSHRAVATLAAAK